MAGPTINSAAKVAGYTLGGSGVLCLVGTVIVGMLILSLIPIYISNESTEGYGEIYTIPGFTIKAVYTNVSVNFTGGSVISLVELSNICTAIFRAKNIKNFYACVASNFTAYGPTGNIYGGLVRRRRALDDVALYEIGDMYLLFSNACSNKRSRGKWSTNLTRTENSSCVARRSAACRSFITSPNTGGITNQWSPFPSGYTQLIVTNVTGCAAVSISSMFNVNYYNYAAVYGRFANTTRSSVNAGDCQVTSVVPQSTLQALVNNQSSYNVSICASSLG